MRLESVTTTAAGVLKVTHAKGTQKDSMLRCQYLYFCTSKASNLRTWRAVVHASRVGSRGELALARSSSGVSVCTFVLVMLLEKTPAVLTVAVSGIAGLVCDLPENFEKWKKKEATRLHDRVERSAASLTAYCPFARLRE